METIVYLDGAYVPASQAKVSVFDRCFLYGDGCFETMIVRRGRPFRLSEHVERMFRSAQVLRIAVPLSPAELQAAVLETVRRNGFPNAYIRITLSRGTGYPLLDPRLAERPTVVIAVVEMSDHAQQIFLPQGTGLRCIIASTRRTASIALEPRIKACNYLNLILARFEAMAAGVDDVIMLDGQNFVCETPGRNVFVVRGQRLLTPREHNVLAGITRRTVIELAQECGWPVAEADLTAYDLYTADEVFATSTVGGVVPIVEIDGRTIGDGQPGPITQALSARYEALLAGEAEQPLPAG